MISLNDLGAGILLFTQLRPTKSKERLLYSILDPQNRGFIIANDFVNALTKADTIAKSNGSKLFDTVEEIYEEASK